MGVGKSTIARQLSKDERIYLFEVDDSIQERTRMDIKDIHSRYGEQVYREIETTALMASVNYADVVVDAGGGLPCFNGNMDWMKAHGIVIYLKMTASELFDRLSKERHKRHLIAGMSEKELKSHIQSQLKGRAPFFELAHHVLDANLPVMTLVESIQELIKNSEAEEAMSK